MHGSDQFPKLTASVARRRIWQLWLAVLFVVSFPSWGAALTRAFLQRGFLSSAFCECRHWWTFSGSGCQKASNRLVLACSL